MPGPRTRKLLRWTGYVVAAVVAAPLILIAGILVVHHYTKAEDLRNTTRTYEAPLAARGPYDITSYAMPLMAMLPARENFPSSGLRFVTMPQNGWHWYAVSLNDTGERIEAILITVNSKSGNVSAEAPFTEMQTSRFDIPRDTYLQAMKAFDRIVDGYQGSSGMCLDGMHVSFERVRKRRITSGAGNCSEHYRQVAASVLALIQPFVKVPYLLKDSWFSIPSEAQTAAHIKLYGYPP